MRLAMCLSLGFCACWSPPIVPDSNGGECDGILANPEPEVVDLLLVIDVRDQSATTTATIYDRTAGLVATLVELESSAPSPLWLHVGVTSADLAAGGALVPTGDRAYLEWAPWLPAASPSEAVRDALARLPAPVGPREPLETIHRALTSPLAANAGFLRSDSALVILVVTDGDDEGTADVTGPITLFTAPLSRGGLRADPRDVWLGLIDGACGKASGWSAPAAPRLQFVRDAIGRGGRALVCDDNFASALPSWGLVDVAPACVPTAVQGGPESCVVYDEGEAVDQPYHASIPSCDVGGTPCFRFTESRDCPSGRGVEIDRGEGRFAPRGTDTVVACACGPDPG